MKFPGTRRRSAITFRTYGVLLTACVAVVTLRSVQSAALTSWDLDSFESPIRVVQPLETSPRYRYLWNLYTDNGLPGTSVTDVVSNEHHDGMQSLHNRFDQVLSGGKNWQFGFYPYTIGIPGFSPDGWQYLRSMTLGPTPWTIGQVNRVRLWLKIPRTTPASVPGHFNFEIGTYLREVDDSYTTAESNNWHFYHQMNLFGTGEWEQLIIDTHPSHQRAADGNIDRGDHLYPSLETPNFTYFDLMTRLYLDFPYTKFPTNPNDFYIDSVTPYVEQANENVAQVYSLHAGYVPTSHLIRVGWSRFKGDSTTKHEVRYAFSDIHAKGWASATPAPNGVITPPDGGGYNGMEWSANTIALSGQKMIYIAIKPQNSALFRQISIPLEGPDAPTGVRVLP